MTRTDDDSDGRSRVPEDEVRRRAPPVAHSRRLLFVRLAVLLAAVTLAVAFREGLLLAIREAAAVGWSFLWVLPVFIAMSVAAVLAWRVLIRVTPRPTVPGIVRLLVVRTEALAVNVVMPAAGLGGDVLRSSLTRAGGLQTSVPPVVLDRVASAGAELLVAVLGLAVYALTAGAKLVWLAVGAGAGVLLLGLLLYCWRRAARLLLRVPAVDRRPRLREVVSALQHRGYRHALRRSVGWHLVERSFMVAEVWLIAYLLGAALSPAEVLFTASITTFFSLALFFMPAQLVGFEAGLAYAFEVLGLPASLGLAVALIRRARQLLAAAVGVGLLLVERGRDRAVPPPQLEED